MEKSKPKFMLKALLQVGEKYIVKTEDGETSEFTYLGEMNIKLPNGTESFLTRTDKCYKI